MFTTDQIDAIVNQTIRYPYKLWGFGEGIALEAIWRVGTVLNRRTWLDWIVGMMDRWLERDPHIVEDDHSAPGALLLDVYAHTQDRSYLNLAMELATHMQNLPVDESGAWRHRPYHPQFHHFIYVDCMEVDAPFFCRLAQTTGEDRYYDLAGKQLLGYARHLQDDDTDLFYHQVDGETGVTNGVYWGRGNGWALLGLVKTLRLLPPQHEAYDELLKRFQRLAASVVACQLPSGDWPTVLDEPNTYAEGSLVAFFAYGLRSGITAGWLPVSYASHVERAYAALHNRLSSDGLLMDVSNATPPGRAGTHYNLVPVGTGFPWGQGPLLLAAQDFLFLT